MSDYHYCSNCNSDCDELDRLRAANERLTSELAEARADLAHLRVDLQIAERRVNALSAPRKRTVDP